MATFSLDVARRARAEARGEERNSFEFGGETFELPAELPLEFGEALLVGNWSDALTALLDGQAADFRSKGPTLEDCRELAESVAKLYTGGELGESSASSGSSKRTSSRPRRRSSGSTA